VIEECLVVEFRVTGDDCPLAAATRATDTTVDATAPQLRSDGNALLQFAGDEAAESDLSTALDDDDRIRYLHATRADGRVNFRCLSKHPCVVHRLTDAGFVVESIQYREGTERYVGAVVGYDVLEGVLEAAGEAVGVTLERVYPLHETDETPVAQRWDLTPPQQVALERAYEMGYFGVPREVTAGDVADDLGISKSAFLERLRRGQDALFGQVFS
jgi:predicted DNA binding protein